MADERDGETGYVAFAVETFGLALTVALILVIFTGVLDGLGYTVDRSLYGPLLVAASVVVALVLQTLRQVYADPDPLEASDSTGDDGPKQAGGAERE